MRNISIRKYLGSALVAMTGVSFAAETPAGVVMAKEQSPHFSAVASQLELGGLRFSYNDKSSTNALMQGGVEMVVDYLNKNTEFNGLDAKKISEVFTLDAVKASGSSASQRDGYVHYRTFNYMPDGKSMYTQAYLDEKPSLAIELAPAGADLVAEMHINAKNSAEMEKKFVAAMGPKLAEEYAKLQKEQAENPMFAQYMELMRSIDSRVVLVGDLSPEGFEKIPGFPVDGHVLLAMTNAESMWKAISPLFGEVGAEVVKVGQVESVQIPAEIPSWSPLVQYDGVTKNLYIASSGDYLTLCKQVAKGAKDSLKDDPHYKKIQGGLPESFSNMVYVSPVFAEKVMFLANLFVVPQIQDDEARKLVNTLMSKLSESAVTKMATIYVASAQEMGTLHVVNTPVAMPTVDTQMTVAATLVTTSTLFVGATYYKESADNAACQINLSMIEKASDAVQNIDNYADDDALTWQILTGEGGPLAEDPPHCPRGGKYILGKTFGDPNRVSCTCGASLEK